MFFNFTPSTVQEAHAILMVPQHTQNPFMMNPKYIIS